jgi:hypothetical protein
MYTYSQGKHTLSRDGVFVNDTGHAGNGAGLNNPAMQNVIDVGPLPRGRYKIAPWIEGLRDGDLKHLGPLTAELIPQPDENGSLDWMLGRGGFYIHGPIFSAGCMAQLEPERVAMSQSGDTDLTVVE